MKQTAIIIATFLFLISPALARTSLIADANYYVAPGGSDSNDGLSPSTPWATWGHAASVIQTTLDLACHDVRVYGSDGVYRESLVLSGAFVGACNAGAVQFICDHVSPQNCTINGGVDAVTIEYHAEVTLDGLDIAGSNRDIVIDNGALFYGNLWLEQTTLAQIDIIGTWSRLAASAPNPTIVALGGAQYFLLAESQSSPIMTQTTIQFGGATPTYSGACFYVDQFADLDLTGSSFPYFAHGKKYDGGGFAAISTNGLGASIIKCDQAGGFSLGSGWLN